MQLKDTIHIDKNYIIITLTNIKNEATNQYTEAVATMQDTRDGVINGVAAFQNNLNMKTRHVIDSKVKACKEEIKRNMDSYVLIHALTLEATLDDSKQIICTKIFLSLQTEKCYPQAAQKEHTDRTPSGERHLSSRTTPNKK